MIWLVQSAIFRYVWSYGAYDKPVQLDIIQTYLVNISKNFRQSENWLEQYGKI